MGIDLTLSVSEGRTQTNRPRRVVSQKHGVKKKNRCDPADTYVARVVDESGSVSLHRSVHHEVVVDPEHVAADAAGRVVTLPDVRQTGADHLPGPEVTPGQVTSGQRSRQVRLPPATRGQLTGPVTEQ